MRRIFTYLLSLLLPPLALQAQVAIDATNFPDNNFRTYVATFDTDGDGTLSVDEINDITSIDVTKKSISSLVGIEHFTNITTLKCANNSLTSLDLSNNINLKDVTCSSNSLTSLNVTGCTALTTLRCESNNLSSLDLSSNTNLGTLNCSTNSLTAIDVSNNANLGTFNCSTNNLTVLDVSNNTSLKSLTCSSNSLTSLDLSSNINLTSLYCGSNSLTSLDVSSNTKLSSLTCSENSLATLNLAGCTALTSVHCESNSLTSLDLSSRTKLKTLYCNNNSLISLNLAGCTALTTLRCHHNSTLTSLDLGSCTKLTEVYCNNSSLTSLNVSGCTALQKFYCQENQLSSLAIASPVLTLLHANNNALTSVDITGCTGLTELRLYRNRDLQYVNFSGNSKMKKLEFFECAVNNIDVSNMPDLDWLSVSQGQLTEIDVSHNTKLTNLVLDENQISELNLSNNPLIKVLRVGKNNFSEIDVSMLPDLTTLYCNDNLLKKLDVTKNTKLTILQCQNNLLTTLDLSKNTSLKGTQLKIGPQEFPQEIEILGDNRGIIAVSVLPSTDESVVTWDQFKTVKLGSLTWNANSSFEDNKIKIYHDNLEEDVELNEHSNYSYVEYEYVAPCGTSSVSSSYKTMKVKMHLNPFVMYVNPNSYDQNGGFYSGTLMLGYPVEVPEGVVAYTASSVSEVGEDGSQSLTMDEVAEAGDVLPANTPVYLRASESAGFYQFRSLVGDATPVTVPDGNLLQGTLSSYRVTSGQVLTLGREKDSGEIGFWPYLGTSSYLYVKKNRCYVDASLVSDGNSANGFFFNFDGDTNAVEQPAVEINTDNEGPWYNLQGVQLMEKPSQKGIYISNGKKIIIK